MAWDAAQYLKFAGPRLRPAVDLLNRVDAGAPAVVCDLGAGAGNVTQLLKARWPSAEVTGVDDSAEMLAAAAALAPEIAWYRESLDRWQPERPADVLFSNAALHWLPDHAHLIPRLVAMIAPGGVLAVQMPRNFSAPSHTAIADAVRSGPWRSRLEPLLRPVPVGDPGFYFDLLSPLCASVDIWETEYLHVLDGADPVKEWIKGTWLAPFLAALDERDRAAFEAAYAALVADAYPRRRDGRTLFPFRRLFILATVPA